ncbi:MAG: hypothetical protein ACQESG_00660 [Nanobdellota archaeon]
MEEGFLKNSVIALGVTSLVSVILQLVAGKLCMPMLLAAVSSLQGLAGFLLLAVWLWSTAQLLSKRRILVGVAILVSPLAWGVIYFSAITIRVLVDDPIWSAVVLGILPASLILGGIYGLASKPQVRWSLWSLFILVLLMPFHVELEGRYSCPPSKYTISSAMAEDLIAPLNQSHLIHLAFPETEIEAGIPHLMPFAIKNIGPDACFRIKWNCMEARYRACPTGSESWSRFQSYETMSLPENQSAAYYADFVPLETDHYRGNLTIYVNTSAEECNEATYHRIYAVEPFSLEVN